MHNLICTGSFPRLALAMSLALTTVCKVYW